MIALLRSKSRCYHISSRFLGASLRPLLVGLSLSPAWFCTYSVHRLRYCFACSASLSVPGRLFSSARFIQVPLLPLALLASLASLPSFFDCGRSRVSTAVGYYGVGVRRSLCKVWSRTQGLAQLSLPPRQVCPPLGFLFTVFR